MCPNPWSINYSNIYLRNKIFFLCISGYNYGSVMRSNPIKSEGLSGSFNYIPTRIYNNDTFSLYLQIRTKTCSIIPFLMTQKATLIDKHDVTKKFNNITTFVKSKDRLKIRKQSFIENKVTQEFSEELVEIDPRS